MKMNNNFISKWFPPDMNIKQIEGREISKGGQH